jgi:hypothetical protein
MSTTTVSAAKPPTGDRVAKAPKAASKAPARKRKAAEETSTTPNRKRKAVEEPDKRRSRKRKTEEDAEAPAPKADEPTGDAAGYAAGDAPEEKVSAPTPRPASSNPTAHAAACKRKQDAINTRFLALVNSGCVSACNGKVLKRLNRKTVEVNGVRQLAFAQFISEPELRFYMQKFGPVPTQPSRKQSGYMRFSKIKREEWRDNPKYININRQNPNGSKAIVSDIAKEWKSFSEEEQKVFKNMTDEDVEVRISELRAQKPEGHPQSHPQGHAPTPAELLAPANSQETAVPAEVSM